MKSILLALSLFTVVSLAAAISKERHVTILGTNDIHGGIETGVDKEGRPMGGLAYWSGVVRATREGIGKRYGNNSGGVLLVDAGDQFQGTLLSNFNEGKLVFSILSKIGYDAVVPGNHDYDFGPKGWLVDQSQDPTKRREVLEELAKEAKFPLVSANTFYLTSLTAGSAEILSHGCKALDPNQGVDFSKARRPEFLRPYVIRKVAGVRVALIGLDHPHTKAVTTADNVADLCFEEEVASYTRVRNELEGKADVFVMVIHNGNTNTEKGMLEMVKKLTEPKRLVDVVISGHTHFTLNEKVNGVPIIQSGSGGLSYGRVDLVWDPTAKKLVNEKTKTWAGVRIYHDRCDDFAKELCVVKENKKVEIEGVALVPDSKVIETIETYNKEVAPLAGRVMGEAIHDHPKDRIAENLSGNLLTDLLRTTSRVDLAILNMGGIREGLKKGKVTYEKLFRVFPFSNHAFVVGPMTAEKFLSVVKRNIQTCGAIGTIAQSGAKVVFERHCENAVQGWDKNAKLISVELLDGRKLFSEGMSLNPELTLNVATLDFITLGGEVNVEFKGIPLIRDEGILREVFADYLLANPGTIFQATIDGRWRNLTP